jgi:hypothetical protein
VETREYKLAGAVGQAITGMFSVEYEAPHNPDDSARVKTLRLSPIVLLLPLLYYVALSNNCQRTMTAQ